MFVRDHATLETEVDRGGQAKLQIDIRLHPMCERPASPETGEIRGAIREALRDALREAPLERFMLASNPQPKRRSWLGQVFAFVICGGIGAAATLALASYHPRSSAIAGLNELGSPAATPGSQTSPALAPSETALPQSLSSTGSAENEPGPGTFGLHQQ